MKNSKIIIKTKSKKYPIYFGDDVLNKTGILIKKNLPNVKKVCVICDKNLPSKFLKKLSESLKKYKLKIYKFRATEKTKSINVAYKLIENLLEDNLTRSD